MELNITALNKNQGAAKVTVSEVSFGREFNEALVHQVVTAYLSGARQGTKAQKTRAEVRGGGIKPWNQKGTGRARAGSIRSPLWRTGGKNFAAAPRDHSQKVNKKMYHGAMRCILSELVRQERLVVVEDMQVSQPKTKELMQQLKLLNLSQVLIVSDRIDENLYLAARNIKNIDLCDVEGINPVGMISYPHVIITVAALKQLEEMLG